MKNPKSLYQGHRFPAPVIMASCPEAPLNIVADQLRSYPAAKAEIPELEHVKHVFVPRDWWLNGALQNVRPAITILARRKLGRRLGVHEFDRLLLTAR
jgi:hypothetical protein